MPTSLPNIRDSVNARSITPVNPTRWFLVPDSTPCSELKTSAVRRCKDRRDLSQRSSGDSRVQYFMTMAFCHNQGFCWFGMHRGEGRAYPAISPNFIVQGDPSTFIIGSHHCSFSPPPRRLLSLIVKFQWKDSSAGWRILRSRRRMK